MVEIECQRCGKSFLVKPGRAKSAKYCSFDCYRPNRSRLIECTMCGKQFRRRPYHTKKSGQRGQFCSFDCYGRWQSIHKRGENNPSWKGGKIAVECQQCGLVFHAHERLNRRYCSRKCFADSRRAVDLNHHYNVHWDRQRRLCLERDNHQCVHCGSDRSLLAHHIESVREVLLRALRQAHELDNLQTVCAECHSRQHNQHS